MKIEQVSTAIVTHYMLQRSRNLNQSDIDTVFVLRLLRKVLKVLHVNAHVINATRSELFKFINWLLENNVEVVE